jgi:hypothetical protein
MAMAMAMVMATGKPVPRMNNRANRIDAISIRDGEAGYVIKNSDRE